MSSGSSVGGVDKGSGGRMLCDLWFRDVSGGCDGRGGGGGLMVAGVEGGWVGGWLGIMRWCWGGHGR